MMSDVDVDVDAVDIEGATPVVSVAVVIASRAAAIVGAVVAARTKLATEEAGVAETDVRSEGVSP
jgi:hypothetical protein